MNIFQNHSVITAKIVEFAEILFQAGNHPKKWKHL